MAVQYPQNSIYYNGFDLTSIPGLLVQNVDVQQIPKRALETYKLARANGEAVISTFWDYREIVITGAFVTTNKAAFEAGRDTLLNVIATANGTLDVLIAGSLRRYTVSLSDSTNIPEFFGGYASVEIHFYAYDPFGYDINATTLTFGNATSTPVTYTMAIGGTFDMQPVITLLLNSFSGTGTRNVILTNPETGLATTISRVWSNADVVVIDTKNRIVTINGVISPWTGALPTWPTGTRFLQYSDTFTGRQMAVSGTYTKRYI